MILEGAFDRRYGLAALCDAVIAISFAVVVIRALRILRDEGILDFTRGRGVRVVATAERSKVLTKLDEMLHYASQFGYQPDDVISMIQRGSDLSPTLAPRDHRAP